MAFIAYIRVSTGTQDFTNQKLAILEYANKRDFQIDQFVSIIASASKVRQDETLLETLAKMKPGDTLIVTEISRLARNLGKLILFIDKLVAKKCKLIAIKENLNLVDNHTDMQTKMMLTLFGMFAEIERDLISMRTREALAIRKALGKKLGRPKGSRNVSHKLDEHAAYIKDLVRKQVGVTSISKILGVHRRTVSKFISDHLLKPV